MIIVFSINNICATHSKPSHILSIFCVIFSHSAHDLSKSSCEEAEKKKLFNTRVLSEHNRRLAGAIAAYGKSLNVNKGKRRPTSAVLSDRSMLTNVHILNSVFSDSAVSSFLEQISSALLNRPGSAKSSETMAFGKKIFILHSLYFKS